MKRNKSTLFTFAEKCRNVLASNWQGSLNTIKADAKGSKGNIHTSKVKYIVRRGHPYLWVPESDMHNVNTIIDERGSFAVTSPFPGPLGVLLKSLKKLPARIALSGDVIPLQEDKAKSLAEKLQEVIVSEQKAIKEFTYTVSGVLCSSASSTSRSDNLQGLLGDNERYNVYRFKTRSCTFIDGLGGTFDVDIEDLETSKADPLAQLSAKIIDGINQSEARRTALMLFCFVYKEANAKDAYIKSIDRKGFDVLAKVTSPALKDSIGEHQWKEFRFMFKENMKLRLRILLIALVLCAPFSSSLKPKDRFLGIAPEDDKYYRASDVIRCKDGSGKFNQAQLNDDFCDCADGTDEPGTSACPGGRFFCRNAGHSPVYLFSSRVNDGICDCCDGTDEYDGQAMCPNTCWEAGKVARDRLEKKIATYKEGVKLRKQEIEQAKVAIEKDEAELSKLKKEESVLKVLVKQLKDHKEQIEKAEEKERLQKEKEEMQKKEFKEKANEAKDKTDEDMGNRNEAGKHSDVEDNDVENNHDKIENLEGSPADQDEAGEKLADVLDNDDGESDSPGSEGSLHNKVEEATNAKEANEEPIIKSETNVKVEKEESSDENGNKGNGVTENTEGLSREELGRLVASRWTGEKTDVESAETDTNLDNEDHEDLPKETKKEEYEGYASETDDESNRYDDDTHKYDDEDDVDEEYQEDEHDDLSSSYKSDSDNEPDLSDNPSWLEKVQKTVRNILQVVNLFQAPVNQSDAARVRKEYDESSAKLSKIQSRISSLTQKLKHDFGPAKEFYTFYDHCFEGKENKYTYKVCPYKQASQEEGYSTTRLGRWDKFEDSYKIMFFSNGDKCWNGPDRSLKVKLRCGLKNEITDVDEPSRCEYVALLSTPALCQEERLKELQHRLDLLNVELPANHDEL